MNENMKVYEQVRAVPKEALKAINGGRLKGMSDINPMWRIKMLTEMFGICGIGWKIEITDKRLENGGANEIVCFVDINLYVKADGEWSAPIPGMGGSSFVTAESSGRLYTSDECFKMAYTDAISVACKSLGFAADVYYANDRTKYTSQEEPSQAPQGSNNRTASQSNQSTNQQTQQRTGQPAASSGGQVELATENQVKMLRAKRRAAGFTGNDEINRFLGMTLTSLAETPKSKVNELIKFLDEQKIPA